METKIIEIKVIDGDVTKATSEVDALGKSINKVENTSKKAGVSTKDAFSGAESAASNLKGGVSGIAEQFSVVTKAAKKGGAAMRSALISTGVGALIVALGLIVDNWEEIGEFLGFINKDLEKQSEYLKINLSLIDSELSLLEKQIKFNDERNISNEENLKLQKELLKEKKLLLANQIKLLEAQLLQEESSASELSLLQKTQILLGLIPKDLTLIDPEEAERINNLKEQILKLKEEAITVEDALDPVNRTKKRGKGVDAVKLERETPILDPADDELQEEIDKEVARLQAITDIRNQFKLKNEELDAIDEVAKIELERERDLAELDRLGATLEQKAELNAYYDALILSEKKKTAEEESKIDKAVADAKLSIQQQSFNVAEQGIGLLKKLFEKNKGLQKALLIAESAAGIAKIVVNTQAANAAATLKYALLPGGAALAKTEQVLNKISAGIGIAANVASTAAALKALGSAGGVSKGNANLDSGQGSTAPSFNVVGNSGVSQIAQTLNQEQEPIEAYVVASNVSSAQEANRNIVDNATLG